MLAYSLTRLLCRDTSLSQELHYCSYYILKTYAKCIFFFFFIYVHIESRVYRWYVYVIWMWIDWYRKYQPAEPEYEVCWRVSEANESQTSYSVEQADIFQYQSYSHSDDMFIILKSNTINTDTSIFVFSREKLHDSKY